MYVWLWTLQDEDSAGKYNDATGEGTDHIYDQWWCNSREEAIALAVRLRLTNYTITFDGLTKSESEVNNA